LTDDLALAHAMLDVVHGWHVACEPCPAPRCVARIQRCRADAVVDDRRARIIRTVTGWTLATKARLGMLDEARASLAGLSVEQAVSGEVCNAAAVIHLAEGDPTAALGVVDNVPMFRILSSMTSLSSSPICSPRGRTVS